jgi:hypothetical protein
MLSYSIAKSNYNSYKVSDSRGYLFLIYDYCDSNIRKSIRMHSSVNFYLYIFDVQINNKLSHYLAEKTMKIIISGMLI